MSKDATPKVDGRRLKGDRTRRAIAVRAAERASLEGLEQVSLGRIATDLGISKGGIQAVYATKEDLQVAAVEAATEIFVEHVVKPAMDEPPGLTRLWALIDRWLGYVDRRVFPGGCFMAATVPEFDSQPGRVRDALTVARRAWLALLEGQLRQARQQGVLSDELTPSQLAFEIDALLTAANTACNLADQPEPLNTARAVLAARLGAERRHTARKSKVRRPGG